MKRLGPLSIVLIYLVSGALWILVSDRLAEFLFSSAPERLVFAQHFKGLFFVLATGLLLYGLMRRDQASLVSAHGEARENASRYRRLFESMIGGFAHCEIVPDEAGNPSDYRFLDVNPAYEKMTGLTRDALAGRRVREIFPDTEDHWIEIYGRVALTGDPVRFTIFDIRSDRYFEASAFRPAPGTFAVAYFDITERKRAEDALRRAEREWRRTFDAIEDMITIQGTDRRIRRVNAAALRILDIPEARAAGAVCHRLLWDREEPCGFCPGTGGPGADGPPPESTGSADSGGHECEIFHTRLDRTFQVSLSPIRGDGGEIEGYVHVAKDVTERKWMEARLRQAQTLEAVGTLAGGIAHDFNNLLFPLSGHAEIALEELPPDSPVRPHLEDILMAARRARDLVRQILAFSRKGKPERHPLRLQALVREVLQLLRSTLPGGVRLEMDIDEACGPVMADSIQLHQLLVNLCTNARQAMETDGGTLTVELRGVALSGAEIADPGRLSPGSYARLRVADTGPGMSPDVLAHIYDPYFTTKAAGKGTGLGLALAHRVVREHDGDIRVRSEEGRGTVFDIFLPRTDAEEIVAPVEGPAASRSGPAPAVLAVDDEAEVTEMMALMLERSGCRPVPETDPERALARFRKNPAAFDLLVSDLSMPGTNGIELARAVREIRPDLPVILCTGFLSEASEAEIAEAGIRWVLPKPVSRRRLAAALGEALGEDAPSGA